VQEKRIYFNFSDDRLDFVLSIYAEEIKKRYDWIILAAKELDEIHSNVRSLNAVEISTRAFRNSMDLIDNAMIIYRIVNGVGALSSERERVKERVRLLRERCPQIPDNPPNGLSKIRNDYEHFESRLDDWAVKDKRSNYIDMNVGPPTAIYSSDPNDINLRAYNNGILYFMNREIDLREVVAWARITTKATEALRNR